MLYFKRILTGITLVLCLLFTIITDAQVGYITTIAGKDSASYSGDGGPADTASLNFPNGVAVDTAGNVYIADWLNNRVRKVNALTGIITTVAGNGTPGYTGNGGAATSAELNNPLGVAVDDTGNIYIADAWNHVIRKVQASTGKISTVAGNAFGVGTPYGGYSGDGGAATSAELNSPMSVAVDDSGNIYIADYYNNRIRKVSVSNHHIQTIAGNGFGADTTGGYGGDGGLADSAMLFKPTGVAVDDSGNVYIADAQNNRIRMVAHATQIITTVAGNGYGAPSSGGFSGNGGNADSARLYYPTGLALDASRNIYFTDRYNNCVRKVDASTHIITSIAGDEMYGFGGDGGPADSAQLAQPAGIAVDDSGNVYIADVENNRIRKVLNNNPCTPTAFIPYVYDSICTGTPATFHVVINNGGSKPIYQWRLNGANAGTDSIYFTYTPAHNGDRVSCIVTSNANCAFPKITTSDTLSMGIYNGQVKPMLAITASADSVCSNIPVTFSSSVLRGGVNPIYTWKLNGDSVGDSSAITLANLQTGNIVSCVLVSSLTCAHPDTVISNTINMVMDSAVTPNITIAANANPVCAGASIVFTISSQNGGNNAICQWNINGINTGLSDSIFTGPALANGDTVNALLLSSLGCVSSDSAFSNNIIARINPVPAAPVVTQSGDSLISNYATGNQWYYDSAAITGATGAIYQPAQSGNYYDVVTDSSSCVSGNSDTIVYVLQSIVRLGGANFSVFPNPSNGGLFININAGGYTALHIFDDLGREVYFRPINISNSENIYADVSNMGNGIYILKLSGSENSVCRELVIQK